MRLATFHSGDGAARLGIVEGLIVRDVGAAGAGLPRTMIELIEAGPAALAALTAAARAAPAIALGDAHLYAPIPRPPEFLGIGLNYRDHAGEAGLDVPDMPLVINKQSSCVTGPRDPVILPRLSAQLDYEGELGIVVGRAGRHMSREQAAAAIFGYVVINDVSVRDWQLASPTMTLGKSFDTHGPFGPWITTAGAIADAQRLTITTRVNGEVRQSASTAGMLLDCAGILAFLSQVMTLAPGTVVGTGTPAGVGLGRDPPAFLRAGDVVSVEISELGMIENEIVPEAAAARR